VKNLNNKKILVGITGSIAAYKAAQLVSNLKTNGAHVKVIMTKASTSFITERTLESISKNRVLIDESETEESFLHLDVSKWADIILIAPCTANSLNKITNGLGDDLLSTTCLAFKGKIFIAPAMNPNMWNNSILQDNLKNISRDKFEIIGPDYGNHACGDVGYGRMSSPDIIVETLSKSIGRGILDGIKILVTAGPTREPIDPVRFISNYSSGKMGYAIAEYARDLGGDVKLISGPVKLPLPEGLQNKAVETSTEMLDEVLNSITDCDIFISAAAISDYKPSDSLTEKHKSTDGDLSIKLVRGEDILKTAKKKNKNIYAVGFSAETKNIEENAKQKLLNKKIDMIIANEANHQKGVGFESDYNQIVIINKNETTSIPINSKKELAKIIINRIASIYRGNLLKLKNAR
jgi:phosphopantothenoylcysteine decarboxylase/phosphopantothenate--cysteine ligase